MFGTRRPGDRLSSRHLHMGGSASQKKESLATLKTVHNFFFVASSDIFIIQDVRRQSSGPSYFVCVCVRIQRCHDKEGQLQFSLPTKKAWWTLLLPSLLLSMYSGRFLFFGGMGGFWGCTRTCYTVTKRLFLLPILVNMLSDMSSVSQRIQLGMFYGKEWCPTQNLPLVLFWIAHGSHLMKCLHSSSSLP